MFSLFIKYLRISKIEKNVTIPFNPVFVILLIVKQFEILPEILFEIFEIYRYISFLEIEIQYFIKQCQLKFVSGSMMMMNKSWCKVAVQFSYNCNIFLTFH